MNITLEPISHQNFRVYEQRGDYALCGKTCQAFSKALSTVIAWTKRTASTVFYAVVTCLSCGRYERKRPIDNICIDNVGRFLEAFNNNERAIRAVHAVQRILAEQPVQFAQAHDNHTLHIHLTVITDAVRDNPLLKRTWETYLRSIQNLSLRYPGNERRRLDVSIELERLERRIPNLAAAKLDPTSPRFEQDLREVGELERECFTGANYSARVIRHFAVSDPIYSGCIVVRNTATQEILGYLLYGSEENQQRIHIYSVGRKAGAAKLGIGEALFQSLFQENFGPHQVMSLQVRASNTFAQALYQSNGFADVRHDRNYYSDPQEDSIFMERLLQQQQQNIA